MSRWANCLAWKPRASQDKRCDMKPQAHLCTGMQAHPGAGWVRRSDGRCDCEKTLPSYQQSLRTPGCPHRGRRSCPHPSPHGVPTTIPYAALQRPLSSSQLWPNEQLPIAPAIIPNYTTTVSHQTPTPDSAGQPRIRRRCRRSSSSQNRMTTDTGADTSNSSM